MDVQTRPLAERKPLLQWPCLVLNSDFRPLATFPPSIEPVREGIEKLYKRKVDLVEAYDGVFRSPSMVMPAPKVIVLRHYVQVYGEPKFCRRNILLRDRFCCQYCGTRFDSPDLTYDHVHPKSKGGRTVWENVVAACLKCNMIKRDSLPNYSGRKRIAAPGLMRPLKEPRRPTAAELYRAGLEVMPAEQRLTFRDYLYWNAELLP